MKLLILAIMVCLAFEGTMARGNWNWRCHHYWSWFRWSHTRQLGLPACNTGDSWYHLDECRCDGFYQCFNGTINHFLCPPGEVLKLNSSGDPEGCFPPWDATCGNRPYYSRALSMRLIRLTITVKVPNVPDVVYNVAALQLPLVYSMRLLEQEASSPTFSFESTSHAFFGKSVTTINGLTANPANNEYWAISKAPSTLLKLGVSSYIPRDQEHIIFEFSNF